MGIPETSLNPFPSPLPLPVSAYLFWQGNIYFAEYTLFCHCCGTTIAAQQFLNIRSAFSIVGGMERDGSNALIAALPSLPFLLTNAEVAAWLSYQKQK